MKIFIFFRLVYKWFYFIYKLSYVLGILGYILVLFTFVGLNIILDVKPHIWMDWGILFLFYGLYFGVLGRDVAEICADTMASHIGVCIISCRTSYYAYNVFVFIFNMLYAVLRSRQYANQNFGTKCLCSMWKQAPSFRA